MATLIKIDGTQQEVKPQNNEFFSLSEMQQYVGGLIQIIRFSDEEAMVVNEEGKLMGLEVNEAATNLALDNEAIFFWDCVVGNALICSSNELR